jgi:hypothetical protein
MIIDDVLDTLDVSRIECDIVEVVFAFFVIVRYNGSNDFAIVVLVEDKSTLVFCLKLLTRHCISASHHENAEDINGAVSVGLGIWIESDLYLALFTSCGMLKGGSLLLHLKLEHLRNFAVSQNS